MWYFKDIHLNISYEYHNIIARVRGDELKKNKSFLKAKFINLHYFSIFLATNRTEYPNVNGFQYFCSLKHIVHTDIFEIKYYFRSKAEVDR